VQDWIFGYRDGTDVITHEGDSLKDHESLSQCVQSIRFESSSYILRLGGELSNSRLFLRRLANKRRSKKMESN
jgi:hypothetical protein